MRATTKRLVLATGCLGMLLGVVQGAIAQSANSEIGTWKLNLAKSKYTQGPAPKSTTTKIEAAGAAGIKVTVDTVDADGTARHFTYTANYDGKDTPVTGNAAQGDTVARTRSSATTTKSVWKKGGKVTTTQTAVVSSDGKTRTITAAGTNAAGQAVNSVALYEKQ